MNTSKTDLATGSIEDLVAGTFALMTTWADPQLSNETLVTRQRDLIARKIVSNLQVLKVHPQVNQQLRLALNRSCERWLALAATKSASDVYAGPAPPQLMATFKSTLIH